MSTPKAAVPAEQKPMRRACLQKQLRKTKLCTYYLKGACQFGEECAFAHSNVEMEDVPDLRKTRLCKAFQEGACTNGNCTFAHGENELRSTDMFFKKTLCFWNDKGRCRSGSMCRFAHSLAELKAHAGPGEVVGVPAVGSDSGSSIEGNKATRKQRRQKKAVTDEIGQEAVPPVDLESPIPGGASPVAAEPMKILQANCADAGSLWEAQEAPGDFIKQVVLPQVGHPMPNVAELQGVQMQATLETLKQNILTLTAQWSTLQQVMQVQQASATLPQSMSGSLPSEWANQHTKASGPPPLFPDYNEPVYFMQQNIQEPEAILPPPGLAASNKLMVSDGLMSSKFGAEELDYSFGWDLGSQALGA